MPSGADLEYARMLAQSGQTSGAGLDGARLEQMGDERTFAMRLAEEIGSSLTGPKQGGLPLYAGTRTRSWDAGLCLYNGESPALRTFRAGLRDAITNTGSFRITCIGDSKTFGSGLTAGSQTADDSYPAQLATLIGAAPGMAFANLSDFRWTANTGFSLATWASPGAGVNYLQKSATGAGGITFTTRVPCSGVKIYAYSMGGAANATLSISIDGGAAATWVVSSGSPWRTQSYTGLANTTHTVAITTSDAAAILGIEHLYSANKVIVDNAGRQSATGEAWKISAWPNLWHSSFVAPAPVTSAVIMNLGTNAAGDTLGDLQTTAANIATLGKPLLLLVPGGLATDRNVRKTKLYDVADSLDLPLIDLEAVIGNTTSATAVGMMGDTLHENVRGYSKEAWAVSRVILA